MPISGAAFMSAQKLQAKIDAIPYAHFLNFKAEHLDGIILTRMVYGEHLIGNPFLPAIHGGVLGAFLEMTAVIQLMMENTEDTLPKTVDITIDYLRSARPMDTSARAFITKHGRRVANVRAQAWQEDADRPVALLHGHFLLPPLNGH